MSMRPFRLTIFVLALPVLLVAAGCGGSSDSSPSGPSSTASTPSFAQQVQAEILTPGCATCHTDVGRTPAGGLNLRAGASYAALVGVASTGKAGATRVVSGNPGGSYLVQKLEGAADIVGLRMPRNASPLSTEQIALIRQWIQNGAPNN